MIKSRYNWSKDHEAFIGIVYEEQKESNLVVSVGLMQTEIGIKSWLKDTMERRAWEDRSELPDMSDSVQ
jgi:hypothetical protein